MSEPINADKLHAMLDAILSSTDEDAKQGVAFLIQISFKHLKPVKSHVRTLDQNPIDA
jgi:hypothetical protein